MLTGGVAGDVNTSAAPLNASQGLSGSNDIGDNLPFDAGDPRNPAKRPLTTGAPAASRPVATAAPTAAGTKWGVPGQGLVNPDEAAALMKEREKEGGDGYDKPVTTRSAGSLQRDGPVAGGEGEYRRPHTAHAGGRATGDGNGVEVTPLSVICPLV
jgi:hypothetical protein